MEKKYVVACEQDLIGIFYLKPDGYYSGIISDALQFTHDDALRTVHWFNYFGGYRDDLHYYVVEVPESEECENA